MVFDVFITCMSQICFIFARQIQTKNIEFLNQHRQGSLGGFTNLFIAFSRLQMQDKMISSFGYDHNNKSNDDVKLEHWLFQGCFPFDRLLFPFDYYYYWFRCISLWLNNRTNQFWWMDFHLESSNSFSCVFCPFSRWQMP